MRHSSRFLSTFEPARPEFEPSGRQKSHISSSFCLLSRPRALNFNQPVDKNHTFPRFLSTFGTARPRFRPAGRQKSGISPGFCLLSSPRALNFDQPVDKTHTFPPVFVYFRARAHIFGAATYQAARFVAGSSGFFNPLKNPC